MTTIDLNRIRKALPNRAKVTLVKYNGSQIGKGSPAIRVVCYPTLSEKDFEMCKQWQREIIGDDNISEIYTETTGGDWFVFLKRMPMEFVNASDEDVNSFTNMDLIKEGTINKQKP
jgi:hypothetical protein